ncbi:hypothetical protein BDR05DRAFT_896817, partial [Suillus weaverae]
CMYQHHFRYGFVDNGSKNKPCRNIPLKCELCHPALPPEPGRTSRRTVFGAVEAIWRYNMPGHILKEHEEYSVPGYKSIGVPLPASMLKAMALSDLEQTAARIPKERRLFTCDEALEKENIVGGSKSTGKCCVIQPTASLPSKRARTAMKPLQITATIV